MAKATVAGTRRAAFPFRPMSLGRAGQSKGALGRICGRASAGYGR